MRLGFWYELRFLRIKRIMRIFLVAPTDSARFEMLDDMVYEMIERVHNGTIVPPRGLARGRMWMLETILPRLPRIRHFYGLRLRIEMLFTVPAYIAVVCRIDPLRVYQNSFQKSICAIDRRSEFLLNFD
jgi:hypothetical protein